MSKLHLLGILIIFFTGLLLGYGFGNKKEVKFFGARETALLNRIDSLKGELVKHDTIIVRIKNTKIRIKKEYETDTIWINNAPFDSLNWLFTKYYPDKPVSDSVYSER